MEGSSYDTFEISSFIIIVLLFLGALTWRRKFTGGANSITVYFLVFSSVTILSVEYTFIFLPYRWGSIYPWKQCMQYHSGTKICCGLLALKCLAQRQHKKKNERDNVFSLNNDSRLCLAYDNRCKLDLTVSK